MLSKLDSAQDEIVPPVPITATLGREDVMYRSWFVWIENSKTVDQLSQFTGKRKLDAIFLRVTIWSAPGDLTNSEQWSISRAQNSRLQRKVWEPLALTTFLRDTVLLFAISSLPRQQPKCATKKVSTTFNPNTW
jgi:hypothetical protein